MFLFSKDFLHLQKYFSSLRFLYDKTPKRPNAQTPKRPNAQTPKRLLAVLLCLLVLHGCKRHLLDPLNPQTQQTNLPAKVQLDKVKGFYENGRYKNQPKQSNGNERMTAADSARFKDFEPQWDKIQVELLPNNEKMLIVPVVRFLNVEYNQNIGFIRRLCIRVDANDDFLEANIVEIVGNLTFVKNNYNNIFANYKNSTVASSFNGFILVYGLDYIVITQKAYTLGNFTKNVVTEYISASDVAGLDAKACHCYVVFGSTGVIAYINTCSGTATSGGGSGSGEPIYDPSSGGEGGNGGGGDGGTGVTYDEYGNPIYPLPPPKPYEIPIVPTTTTPITITPSPPIPPMPFPGMLLGDDLVWYFPDSGVSWGYWNYLIEEDENTASSGITEDPSLFLPENADIKAIYDAIKTQPEWTNYIKYFNANDPANSSLTIKIGDMPAGHEESLAITNRDYQTNTATIIINQNTIRKVVPTNIALAILHEGIHAKLFSLIKRNLKGLVLTTAEKTELINLARMMKLYGRNNGKGEHTYIGRYYVNSLTRGMKAFQTLSPTITDLHYKVLIFAGLGNTPDVKAFINGLPNGEADFILMLLEITID